MRLGAAGCGQVRPGAAGCGQVRPGAARCGQVRCLLAFSPGRDIVVVEVGRDDVMELEESPALQARLGPDATTGLLALLETAREEWEADVTAAAVERFERRLTEEVSGLGGEMREGEARLREEMRDLAAALREEGRVHTAALREEMRSGTSGLRVELTDEMSKLRVEVADTLSQARVDMMRWSFSLWVGQVVATAAIVARDVPRVRAVALRLAALAQGSGWSA